ncbi:MAG: hypothetical protein K0R63_260 [Rickettsiales bacterium]|jgi:Flp pilus assembly protein TadD|nr:hypothetical protein [Rickettsiales bacterium]
MTQRSRNTSSRWNTLFGRLAAFGMVLPVLCGIVTSPLMAQVLLSREKDGISPATMNLYHEITPEELPQATAARVPPMPKSGAFITPSVVDVPDVTTASSEQVIPPVVPPTLSPQTEALMDKVEGQIEKVSAKEQMAASAKKSSGTITMARGRIAQLEKESASEPEIAMEVHNDGDRISEMAIRGIDIVVTKQDDKESRINKVIHEAFDALMSGQEEAAIALYKEALIERPKDKSALFGLATTYQKVGQLDEARGIYKRLLEVDPMDPEVLNNFIALAAEESPAGALKQIEGITEKSPNFGPAHAQAGILHAKLGEMEKAVASMKQAIRLEPQNVSYRYNLGIMLDTMGRYADAAFIYKQVIGAAEQGAVLPAPIKAVQDRYNYVSQYLESEI